MTGSRQDHLDQLDAQERPRAYCTVCRTMVHRAFRPGPDGRPGATCPRCRSLERHRFLSLLLGALAPELSDVDLLVEIAPSRQSTLLLDRVGAKRTLTLDLGHDKRDVDALACLTRLPLPDASVDLLVCYHVLEHVPDDCAAMREIARVLSPRGIALVQVPFRSGVDTEEDPSAPAEERARRFGQSDHVRWYGDDFDARLARSGLASVRVTPPALVGDAAVSWFHLMTHEVVWVVRPGHEPAPPMPPAGDGSGLSAAFDAVLGDLARAQDRLARSRQRAERLLRERDALQARPPVPQPRDGGGVLTRLRRVVRL